MVTSPAWDLTHGFLDSKSAIPLLLVLLVGNGGNPNTLVTRTERPIHVGAYAWAHFMVVQCNTPGLARGWDIIEEILKAKVPKK